MSACQAYQWIKLLWICTLLIIEDRVNDVENLYLCK